MPERPLSRRRAAVKMDTHHAPPSPKAYEEALMREYGKVVEAQRSTYAGHLWRDPRKEEIITWLKEGQS